MAETNRAVLKALEILDLLGQSRSQLLLKDIAARLDLPESTTHRLLASLTAKGYAQQRDSGGPYSLGWKIVTLARALQPELRLMQELRPHLERLVRQLQNTVNLGVLNDLTVLYLDCLVPDSSMSLYTPPGLTVPVYATSLGKCLLAHIPDREQASILSRLQFEPLTPHTMRTREQLEHALREIRLHGYAVDHGEFVPGVTCIAVPVVDRSGRAVAAVSMTARTTAVADEWEEQTAQLMRDVVQAYETPDMMGSDLYVPDAT